jgi:CheY-like chemotaxis protein
MQILIAEDNTLNQKLIQKMLRKLGYEPVIVEDGREAVEAVKSAYYNLLLMDLQMPKVDGIEATRIICEQIPEENRPVIIALTAAVSSDIKKNCMDVGMKDFISKPISIKKLVEILKQYH